MALSTLATQQAKARGKTVDGVAHMLDYLATNPDAMVRFVASDMILNIHSDASYLSEAGAKSRAGGFFSSAGSPATASPSA